MFQAIKEMMIEWNSTYNERAKLQHAYIVVSVIGIVIAGLVGLLNYDASRTILRICFIGLGIVVANAVAWALLSGMILNRLPARRPNTKK